MPTKILGIIKHKLKVQGNSRHVNESITKTENIKMTCNG